MQIPVDSVGSLSFYGLYLGSVDMMPSDLGVGFLVWAERFSVLFGYYFYR